MKKMFLGLSLIALLAGCASNDNGMGGTRDNDRPNRTDEYNTNNSSDQFNNNATHGTGTDSTIDNNATTKPGM